MNTTEQQAYAKAEAYFNELTRAALSQGQTIHTASMSGTQGERARIDFYDGDGTITRLTLDTTYDDYGRTVWVVTNEEYETDPEAERKIWGRQTLWTGKGQNRQEEYFRYGA